MKANGIRIFYLECDLAETPRMRSLADESNKDVRYYTSERDDARVPHWSWCGSQAVALPPRDHASTVWGRPGAPKRVHEPTYALCACPGPCPLRGPGGSNRHRSRVLFEESTLELASGRQALHLRFFLEEATASASASASPAAASALRFFAAAPPAAPSPSPLSEESRMRSTCEPSKGGE